MSIGIRIYINILPLSYPLITVSVPMNKIKWLKNFGYRCKGQSFRHIFDLIILIKTACLLLQPWFILFLSHFRCYRDGTLIKSIMNIVFYLVYLWIYLECLIYTKTPLQTFIKRQNMKRLWEVEPKRSSGLSLIYYFFYALKNG